MDTLLTFSWNFASFIVVLGILVTFHEFGHFWVARRAGVKVLKFSIGFGKPLYSWYGNDGVEYIIARIPLGGYVKMLDENEGEVVEELKPQSFNRATLGKRFAIVAAGPVANLLLAIILFWMTFMIGIPSIKPVIGTVLEDSPATQSKISQGDLIVAVDDIPVKTWTDVRLQLATHLGEQVPIKLSIKKSDTDITESRLIPLRSKIGEDPDKDPLTLLGFEPYIPDPGTTIGNITADSAAAEYGLRKMDTIIKIDQKAITKWTDISRALENKANKNVELTVLRDGQWINLKVIPRLKKGDTSGNGYLGIEVFIDEQFKKQVQDLRIDVQYGPLQSLAKAWDKTLTLFSLSFKVITRMVTGDVSVKNLSGPVGIAQGAGNSANAGIGYFLGFMAMISVSLGFLNLLPVPVLDGGHLFFYTIEALIGKPVPQNIQAIGMQIGVVLILTLTVIALFNDFVRIGY